MKVIDMLFQWKTNVKLVEIISIELRYMNWLLLKIIRLALIRKVNMKRDKTWVIVSEKH